MPTSASHPTFTYRLISWILFPAALLFTLLVALKHRNWRYFRERLGFYSSAQQHSSPVWCHCASVGEINTALPLFRRLLAQEHSLLISTNTITGLQTLQNAELDRVSVIFLPLDYVNFYKRLLTRFKPSICLIFETELWPNLFATAHRNEIPVAIVNGRIGNKTLQAPHFLFLNYARALGWVDKIFASSEENAQRFIKLGANASKIFVLDNLKFALSMVEVSDLARPLPFPYLLCASTHADEELQIVHQWQENKPDSLGLVIALRHPQRAGEVCKQIQSFGLNYELHSKRVPSNRLDHIYIIDTLGELAPFMARAELVFMGGSLIPVGGHNVLEPARMNKCIITGPHYQNFTTIVDQMVDADGIVVAKNATDLMNTVNELMDNPSLRARMGNNAKHYVDSKQQILDQYTNVLGQLIEAHS